MKTHYTSIALLFVFILVFLGVLSASANTNNPPQRTLKEHKYYEKKNTSEFEVTYKGIITLTKDDKDIKSMTPGSQLVITQSSFGNKRRLELSADNKGNMTKKYFEGKKEANYDKDGKEWLESLMPELIVKTGIGGRERALRIYNEKGMRAALEEAENVKNGGGSSTNIIIVGFYNSIVQTSNDNAYLYYKVLLDNVKMNDDELKDFIEALAKVRSNSTKGSMLRYILNTYNLSSVLMEEFLETTASLDYNTERGNTLRAFQTKHPINKNNYRDYFRVIDGMSINSEKGNILKPLLKNQKLEAIVFNALCESATKFTNDSEKAAVLRVASQYIPDETESKELFKRSVESLSSPYRYLTRELINLYENKDYLSGKEKIAQDYIISTLKEVKYESANTKKTTTLRKFHSSMTNDPKLIEAYFGVIESMDNNMEKYTVLLELIEAQKLDAVGYAALYYVVEELAKEDFKHGASALIRESLANIPDNKEVMEQLFDALDDIDHASGREEIIRMMCQNKNFQNNMAVLKMLRIAGDIDVDIEKAIALQHIQTVLPKNNDEIMYLYKRLADELDSEYEYARALKGLK
ncbi:MAG: hypothetical protein JEZ09_14410 [Salinivirgaceae bacterium]|nr:hypothetical protein [Salinivirgaceae bacterium]